LDLILKANQLNKQITKPKRFRSDSFFSQNRTNHVCEHPYANHSFCLFCWNVAMWVENNYYT